MDLPYGRGIEAAHLAGRETQRGRLRKNIFHRRATIVLCPGIGFHCPRIAPLRRLSDHRKFQTSRELSNPLPAVRRLTARILFYLIRRAFRPPPGQ
jgi:hypothetical protein